MPTSDTNSSQMPSADGKSLWLVTDVPFWQCRNGSHQRITSLIRYLAQHDFQVTLWYIGIAESVPPRSDWPRFGLAQVTGPAFPPDGIRDRTKWHVDGSLNALRRLSERLRFARERLSDNRIKVDRPPSMTLDDFYDSTIERRFVSDLKSHKPDVVLVEYVSLAYLAEAGRQITDGRIHWLLDTHDVMHQRAERFQAAGLSHWLQITEHEEAAALQHFDSCLAIQPIEANEFSRLAPNVQVIHCGHAVEAPESGSHLPGHDRSKDSSDLVRIGFMAGSGDANEDGIRRFMESVLPVVLRNSQNRVALHVAGTICERLKDSDALHSSVVLDGPIDALGRWYGKIDIVVNPVTIGAGLKIKTIEALAFGKCLVTSSSGMDGLSDSDASARTADGDQDMARSLIELVDCRAARQALEAAAYRYIRSNYHPDRVYGDLRRLLSAVAKST